MAPPSRRTVGSSAPTARGTAAIDTAILRGSDALKAIVGEWGVLAEELDAVPFLRPTWFALWWDAFGEGTPAIVVARRGDTLVGVLPLRARAGLLLSMSNVHSPWFGAVAADDATYRALWRTAILRSRRRLEVGAFREHAPGTVALATVADEVGRPAWIRSQISIPYIDVGATSWDTFTAGLSKNLRKQIRRSIRRLEENGPLRLDELQGAAAVDALDDVFRIEASGWKGQEGTAISSRDETHRFYTGLARWLAEEDWLRLMVLRLGDRAIAFEFIVDQGRTWFPLKAGFDHALAEHSPGGVAQWMVLEAAFAAGIERYDYSGEAREYTSRWTEDSRTSFRIDVFTPVTGVLDRVALTRGRPMAKRLRAARKK